MRSTVMHKRWIAKQTRRVELSVVPMVEDDALRMEAASVLVAMSPNRIPQEGHSLRGVWSRSRGGHPSNPLYRTVLFFKALREMGGNLEAAWVALAWLIGKVEALWSDAPLCVRKAHEAEIQADADEDVMQYRVLSEPAARKAYREKLVRQLAAGHALLAALDREGAA